MVSTLVAVAAKGRVVVFDRQTYGCWGGGVDLGFGECYKKFPGGVDGYLILADEEMPVFGSRVRASSFQETQAVLRSTRTWPLRPSVLVPDTAPPENPCSRA